MGSPWVITRVTSKAERSDAKEGTAIETVTFVVESEHPCHPVVAEASSRQVFLFVSYHPAEESRHAISVDRCNFWGDALRMNYAPKCYTDRP